jgi:phosphatidylglycerol:prolipoprotein diacylglycerol transferase
MLLHPQFDPIAFSLGPLSVRWYGLMYLVAFVQFILLGRYRIRTRPALLSAEQLDDLLFYGMLGVIVGGRLGQVMFYEPAYYLTNPLEILAVWKGRHELSTAVFSASPSHSDFGPVKTNWPGWMSLTLSSR